MRSRYDIDFTELSDLLGSASHATADVWAALYSNGDIGSRSAARPIEQMFPLALHPIAVSPGRSGAVTKYLWELVDGHQVETVLIHSGQRSTACLSSQAGCAMGCAFCSTGQGGFSRSLTTGEIVEQAVRAARDAAPRRISNVVFMGMGEPLANYDNVARATRRIRETQHLTSRSITLSTVGLVPGIHRVIRELLPVRLAVSLHAANNQLRNQLIPINRIYPLEALVDVCREYVEVTRRRISFEWALIDEINDSDEDLEALAAIARPLRAHVNLIPLNPTPGFRQRPSSEQTLQEFRDSLRAAGVSATIRRTEGTDILAACGQLRARLQELSDC